MRENQKRDDIMTDKEFKLKELELMFQEGLKVREGVSDLGPYDTSIGLKKVFFLRNPNIIYNALLIDPHFSNKDWIITGPNMIEPLHTEKYLLTIPPEKETEDDVEPVTEIEGVFEARILWQAFKPGMEPNK